MNKVFRVIWNKSTQSWMAVSELARGRVKSSSSNTVDLAKITAVLSLGTLALTPLSAEAARQLAIVGAQNVYIETNAGTETDTNKKQNILIGETAKVAQTSIGSSQSKYSNAYADKNVVIGYDATSAGQRNVVLGNNASTFGGVSFGSSRDQISIGTNAMAAGTSSIALGLDTFTNSIDGIAIGTSARANSERSISLGINTTSAMDSVAIGSNAKAESFQYSVAIGAESKADVAATQEGNIVVNGVNYDGATGAVPSLATSTRDKSYVVSFGNDTIKRQLKNVAPGKISATSTDAINGSQLYSITKGIQDNTRTYFHVNSTDTKNFDAANKNAQATGANAMAVGPNASSAGAGGLAIGANANVTNSAGIALGIDSIASADAATALGQGAAAKGLNSVAIGRNSVVNNQYSIAIGENANASTNNSIALGHNSVTAATGTNNDYVSKNDAQANANLPAFAGIAKDTSGSVSVGKAGEERQIHHVAAGRISATSTDAVNGSQLYQIANNTGFNIKQNGTAKSRINNNGEVNFTNGTYSTAVVTDGENSSAVKFDVVTQNIDSDATTGVASPNGSTAGLTTAQTVSDAINKAVEKSGWTVKANNDTGERINNNGAVSFNSGDNIVVERSVNNITIKTVQNPTFTDGATVGGMLNANGGLTVAGSKTVSMGGNKITNVQAGQADTDAVNVSQLNALGTNNIKLAGNSGNTDTQALNKSGGLSFGVKGDGTYITSNAAGSDVTLSLTQATKDKIDNAANKDLSNITPAGTTVIKNAAKDAVNVENGTNTVASSRDVNGVKTFKVDVDLSPYARTADLGNTPITYKANGAGQKSTSLSNGLDFKNTNGLTIEAKDNGVVELGLDQATQNAINVRETVKAGTGVTVTDTETNASGGKQFTVSVNDSHIKDKAKEAIEVKGNGLANVTPSVDGEKQIYTVSVSEQGVKDLAKGAVNVTSNSDITVTPTATNDTKTFDLTLQKSTAVTAGDNKVVTSDAVNTAINNSGWNLKANAETDSKKITNGNDVIFQEGKNINITREENKIVVKTVDSPTFTNLETTGTATLNGLTMKANAPVNMGNNKITNVAAGEADTDAVNVSQLNALGNNTLKLNGDSTSTSTQALNKENGLEFGVKGQAGYIETSAKGSDVSLKLSDAVKTKLDNLANNANDTYANQSLSNINAAGIQKIQDQVAIENGSNTIASTRNNNGVKTFKVDVDLTKTNLAYKADGETTSKNTALSDGLTFKNTDGLTITSKDGGVVELGLSEKTKQDIAIRETVVSGNGVTVTDTETNSTGGKQFRVAVQDDHIKRQAKQAVEVVSGNTADVTVAPTRTDLKDTYTVTINKATEVTEGDTKAVTSDAVHKAINASGWKLKANDENGDGEKIANDGEAIFNAGDNIVVTRQGNKIQIATNHNPTFNNGATVGGMLNANGGLTVAGSQTVNMGGNQVHGVANGTVDTDAVNLSQLNATTNNLTTKGLDFTGNDGKTHRNLGETVNISGEGTTKGQYTGKNLKTVVSEGKVEIQFADNPTFNDVKANDVNAATVTTTGAITAGGMLNANGGLTVAANKTVDMGGNQVHGVAEGTADTDAVNVKQLTDTVANSSWNLTNGAVDGGEDVTDKALAVEEINPNDQLRLQAGKNIKVKREANGVVTYATKDDVTFTNVKTDTLTTTAGATIGGMLTANGGLTVAGSQTVNMGGNQVHGVAAGTADTDAVNVSQLNSLRDNTRTYFHVNSQKQENFANANAIAQATGVNALAAGPNATAAGESSVALGDDVKAAAANSVAVGSAALAENDKSIAIGDQAKAKHDNSVALGAGSETAAIGNDQNYVIKADDGTDGAMPEFAGVAKATSGSVSVGKTGAERQIHHVAAGRISATSTDAVNGSQLYHIANNTGFNVKENNADKSRINNNGMVNFVNGTFSTAVVSDGENAADVKFDVVTQEIDSDDTTGVATPNGATSGLTTATTVANAINKAVEKSGWTVKANGDEGQRINNNGEVNFEQGKNINITRDGSKLVVKTIDDVNFATVTTSGNVNVGGLLNANGGLTVAKNQTVDMGGNKITKVAAGTEDTDAVNLSQLNATTNNLTTKGLDFTGNDGLPKTHRDLGQALAIEGEAATTGQYSGKNVKTVVSDGKVAIQIAESPTFVDVSATSLTTTGAITAGGLLTANGGLAVKTGTSVNMGNNQVHGVAEGTADTDAVNVKQLTDTVANSSWNLTNGAVDGGEDVTDKALAVEEINPNDQLKLQAGKNIKVKREANGTVTYATKDDVTFANVTTQNLNVTGASTLNQLTVNGATLFNKGFTVASNQTIDMGGNRIQNVANGTADSDAVNLSQLNATTSGLTNKGLDFTGNDGETHRNLGETLLITGKAASGTNYNSNNVKTVVTDKGVEIQIAENPTFTNVTATNVDTTNLAVSGNSTFGGEGKTFTVNKGTTINMGNNQVKGVAKGTEDTDAVNVKQLTDTVANSSWNLTNGAVDGGEDDTKLTEAEKINPNDQLKLQAGKNIKVKREANGTVTYATKDDVTFANVTTQNLNVTGASTLNQLTVNGATLFNKGFTVTSNQTIDMGSNRIQNVANGIADSDAVNLSQLNATTSGLTNKGLDFTGNDGETHRNLGETLSITGKAASGKNYNSNNVKTVVTDRGVEIQISENPTFTNVTATNVDTTNLTVSGNSTFGGEGKTFTVNKGTTINMGDNKVSGVANGDISATSTDAVNGSQLYAVKQLVGGNSGSNTTIVNPDGSTTTVSVAESNGYTLTTYNVENQKEYRTNNVVEAIGRMNEQGIKFFHTNDGVVDPAIQGENTIDSSASGKFATAVGYQARATGENAIALGKGSTASGTNTISIGTGNQVTGNNSGAIGDPSTVSGDNSYSLGNDNKVATNNTFVVGNNVTQTVDNSVFLGANTGYVAAGDTTKGNIAHTSQTIGGTTYQYAGGKADEVVGVVSVGNVNSDGSMQTRRIQNVAPGLVSAESTDAINGSQLYSLTSFVDQGWTLNTGAVSGTNGVAQGSSPTKVGLGHTVKVNAGQNIVINQKGQEFNIGTSMSPNFNRLTINPNGKVDMGGNRIQNVGRAVAPNDAVNYGQFKSEMQSVDRRLRSGIAGAVATAGLVQAFNPNDSLVAIGGGTYRGAAAVALGYSRVSDNGKVIFKVTGSANNYGDVTGSASVGFKF
ncbi:ESPR-type extended signal peptide-containing protein [Pasteurellaceae bacterium 22721_9_1]